MTTLAPFAAFEPFNTAAEIIRDWVDLQVLNDDDEPAPLLVLNDDDDPAQLQVRR